MKYLQAEHLTWKRSSINKLLWIAPVLTTIFAWVMGGFTGLQHMTFYWWYAFLLPGMIAIICTLSKRKAVSCMPINLAIYEFVKAVILIEKLLLAAVILALLVSACNTIAPMPSSYTMIHCLVGSIGIILASVWQIPLCLYFARRAGIFLTVLLHSGLCIFVPVAAGNTVLWWLLPYCWAAKFAESAMGIQLNGTYAVTPYFSGNIVITLSLSIFLFLVFAFLDAGSFSREEGR